MLPAKYSRLNFGVRLYTNPMFVHLLLTNVFRIDHTPNDRAQRFQLDAGVAHYALIPSVNLLTPLRQAGLPLDGTSSDISGEPVLLLRKLLAATYLASHDCNPRTEIGNKCCEKICCEPKPVKIILACLADRSQGQGTMHQPYPSGGNQIHLRVLTIVRTPFSWFRKDIFGTDSKFELEQKQPVPS